LGFGVCGLGFGVWVLRIRVKGSGFRVQGLGFRDFTWSNCLKSLVTSYLSTWFCREFIDYTTRTTTYEDSLRWWWFY